MKWGQNNSLVQFFNKVTDVDTKIENARVEALANSKKLEDRIERTGFPLALPKGYAEISTMPNGFGQSVQPWSIGYDDGLVYGSASTYKRIFRCSNSFATMTSTDLEYGKRFDEVVGFTGAIWGVFKTYAGFVVVESIDSNNSAIWFGATFLGDFTKVATLDRGAANPMNMAFHQGLLGAGDSVSLVSEYGQGTVVAGMERRLFASFDGGQTWEVIKTLPPAPSDSFNSHWHASAYDPYDGRIWACNGDGDNSVLYYTYDHGAAWDTVPMSAYTNSGLPSHHPQPTLMIPCEDRVVMGPDNGLRPGMVIMHKDKKFTDTVETFSYELGYAVYPKMGSASNKYSTAPYAKDKGEFYFIVPAVTGHRQAFIMGSGDGGRSLHKVGVLNLSKITSTTNTPNGIVGVDKNGYMYIYYGASQIAKVKKPEWIYS